MCKAIMMERAEGKAEGIAEGKAEGIALINALYNRLVLADRIDDMKRAATDRIFQEQLMEEIIPDLLHRDEEEKATGASGHTESMAMDDMISVCSRRRINTRR